MKDLLDYYGIEPIFTHTVSVKRELLKKKINQIFSLPQKFVIMNSFTMNPCKYSIAFSKSQRFHNKHHVRSFSNFVRRKVKTMIFKALQKITLEDYT